MDSPKSASIYKLPWHPKVLECAKAIEQLTDIRTAILFLYFTHKSKNDYALDVLWWPNATTAFGWSSTLSNVLSSAFLWGYSGNVDWGKLHGLLARR